VIDLVRRTGKRLLRSSTVNHALRLLAVARGHGLVLVYHRLGEPAPEGCQIIPSVPVELFKAQMQALGEIADLVSIEEILAKHLRRDGAAFGARRLAIAVTFDDDLPSHASLALPVLRELGVPAAFFLSGRVLLGLGPYWFQQLEALLVAKGKSRTSALLGLPFVDPGDGLVRDCEQNPSLRQRLADLTADLANPEILDWDGFASLAAAGMTIGFHTVDHSILPGMDDAALADAVSRGREQLGAAASSPVRYFAYPYGKADTRAAAALRHAGFDAAFTGHPRPLRHVDDRYRLGRWEPGPLGVDDLLVNLAVRLHRAAPQSPQECLSWT
jgi:peptidoglycan/xylan/chitin deacetylase (PgdA/CDA1 family)